VRERVHLTAEEIRRTVNRVDPRASRATVYNNLHLLIKAGLVREVMSDGQAARYDAGLHRHHHFLCDVCGAIEDVAWFDVPATAAKAALGRRVARDYEVVFRGTCEACGNSGAKRGKRL